jgi:hypothetical protein
MMEIWNPIKSLNSKYLASNEGNIKSVEREVNIGSNKRTVKEHILCPIKRKNGYMVVNLTHPTRKQHLVHRLIAEAFLGIEDGMVVNHKDLNKQNNAISNLEVVTQKQNIDHSCENGVNGRLVLNLQNGVYHNTIKEAAESFGMSCDSLGRRLRGNIKNNTPFTFA